MYNHIIILFENIENLYVFNIFCYLQKSNGVSNGKKKIFIGISDNNKRVWLHTSKM